MAIFANSLPTISLFLELSRIVVLRLLFVEIYLMNDMIFITDTQLQSECSSKKFTRNVFSPIPSFITFPHPCNHVLRSLLQCSLNHGSSLQRKWVIILNTDSFHNGAMLVQEIYCLKIIQKTVD